MKRHILLLTVCLLAVLHVQADPVDAEAARQKAAAFLQGQKAKGVRRHAPAARQLTMAAAGPADSYYIFNAQDGQGYVVVSGEDATEDILGYSNFGTIDTTSMPCGMRMLLDNYADQIAFLRRNGIKRRQNSGGSDDDTPVTSYTIAESRRCRFDQHEPYNASCHQVNGEPTLTGCVATAMAGLMYAYQWPNASTAVIPSYTYISKSDTEETVEAVPANTAIDWAHVAKQYCTRYREDGKLKFRSLEGITTEQRTAVATLMMLAGNSVKSKYNVKGTPAKTSNVPDALKEYFAYNDAVRYVNRSSYTSEEWLSMMRDEIVNHGPVQYRGDDAKENGHSFLLEGFNGNHFLVNFGWSGEDSIDEQGNDVWFLLEVTDFDDTAPLVYYRYDAGAVIDVKPLAHCDVEASELCIDNGNPDDGFFTGTTLTGSITFHNKSESDDAKIIYLLRLTDSSTGSNVRTKQYLMNLAPGGSTTQNFTYSNLTIGHRYVLKAIRLFGEEFYCSPELLCKEDPAFAEDDETPGNEALIAYEYWFDEDYASRERVSMSSNKAVVRASINTDHLQNGLHFLHFRVQSNNNKYDWSGISTSPFLKLAKRGTEARLDYWLDDDYENRVSLSLELNENEDEQLLTLDLSDCAVGVHQLCYQVMLPGSLPSAVQRVVVMKLPKGETTQLEYWFDYDRDHVYTMDGHATEAGTPGYIFNGNLNISGLRPGHHRLHYRGIGSDGQLSTATGSASILVKIDSHGDVVMDSYSISVDGDVPIAQGALNASKEVLFSYVLDAKDLEKGWHTLQTTFWNSYGMSVTEATSFKVVQPDEDAISTPQADEEDDGPIYNLSGMRVNANAKGILIKNGKKFFVK